MPENVASLTSQNIPDKSVRVCHACQYPLIPDFYFCPNCGKVLRPKPLSTSIGKQISLYLVSVLLPPFGLWPAFKYLFQKDMKSKVVGSVAIILTGVSLAFAAYYTMAALNQVNQFIAPLSQ